MQITNRLFIRYRGNAGVIYRCSFDQRNQRQAMDRIGLVHLKTQEVKTVPGAQITPEEHVEITAWVEQRIGQDRADRDVDLRKLNDHMNLTTQWFVSLRRSTSRKLNDHMNLTPQWFLDHATD